MKEDNNEQKLADDQLQQHREWLRVTLASISDAVIATDSRGHVIFLNGMAMNLTGWASEEAQGHSLEMVFSIRNEQTLIPVENPVEKVLREGISVEMTNHTVLVARDGTERPIENSAAPIRDTSGKMIGVVMIFRDVTERRRAEHELRESEARNRAILETALDCVITMDHQGTVVEFNKAAERTFGYSRADVVGRELADLIIPTSLRERHRQGMARYLAGGEGSVLGKRVELPAIHADGSEFPVELSISRIPTDGPPLFTAYLRDIGERTRVEHYRDARLGVTQALNQASDVDEGVSKVLRAVCESLSWDVGFFWMVKKGGDCLKCHHTWHKPELPVTEFEAASFNRTFEKGEGLPGHVWSTGQPRWLFDVVRDANFLRAASAANYNLHSAFASPVVVGDRVIGVMEFFTRRIREPDSHLLEMMGTVAGNVGQFIERQSAEQELRQSEAELADFFENATVGLHWIGADGIILRANRAELDMLGYNKDEYVGQPIADFHADEDVICDILHRLQTGEKLNEYPARLRCKNGVIKDVLIDSSVLWNNGKFVHTRCFTRDITERKRAEEALQESEERFRGIFNQTVAGVAQSDMTGRFVLVNQRYCEIVGRSAEELEVLRMQEITHPDDLPRNMPLFEALVNGGPPFDIEKRYVRPDGSHVWVINSVSLIREGNGCPKFVVAVAMDITERKRAEEMQLQHAKCARLLSDISSRLVFQSTDGKRENAEELLESVFSDVMSHLDADFYFNFDVDDEPETLQLVSQKGLDPATSAALERIRFGEYLCGMVAQTRQPLVVEDLQTCPLENASAMCAVGAQAYAGFPLLADGRLIGTISFATARRKRFTDVELELVQAVANLLAAAVERDRLSNGVRESEEKLRLLADTIPQLAWMARPDGHIFWYNRQWYEYTGKSATEMEGWGWQSVHHPDVLPKVLERWKKSITSGEPFDMVFPLKGVDGQFRPFLTRVNPLSKGPGQILYWFGTSTDITEMRDARHALAVSEGRLRLALEAGRMGVWDWNIRTGELDWTDSLEPLHGIAPGTFGGTFDHFQQLIHPGDLEHVNVAIRQALETGGEFYVEFRNARSSEGIRWIAGSGKVFPGDDGQPLRMVGVGLDVTQRKRAEHTARFLADASAALAVLVDFDSTLKKVSSLAVPSFADWATVDMAEADGSLRRVSVSHIDLAKVELAHEIHRRFPPDPAAHQGVWKILRTGQSEIVPEITDELLVQSTNDSEMLSILRELGLKSYIGVPLTIRGKTLGVITFINAESGHRYDNTDLAVAEDLASRAAIAIENAQFYRELREADRRKDEFLATLAHELRNPLAPIRNGLHIMRLSGDNMAAVEQVRAMMERQLSQMVRLVDDLLDVSRINGGKLDLRKEPVDIAVVVNNAVETSRPLIEAGDHELTIDIPPTPVVVDADVTRLGQVFANLLNNSAKYSDPGSKIQLTAETLDAEVVVSVKDTGVGIPATMLPKIFDIFTQVDRSLEKSQGGLGIGLTLVKRLVEMHGGSVAAQSEGPGKGSTFTVRLPVLVAKSQPIRPSEEEEGAPKTCLRILVVDDNIDAAESLGIMLTLMGNEVRTAADGLVAVETARDYLPDVILLDIGLPKLNGYDACRRIREQGESKEMMIVALTGWGQEEDRRRSVEAGFDHHLVKPVDYNDLMKLLPQAMI